MRTYFLSVISLLCTTAVFARTESSSFIYNDSLLKVYLSRKNFGIDTNDNAIVLYEKATADISVKSQARSFYQNDLKDNPDPCRRL